MTSRRRWKSKPPGRKDSENMPMRKKGHMTFDRANSCDQTIHPNANLLRGLSPGGAVAEKHPSGRLRMDLFGRQPFVFAVIPFHQIAIDFSALAEAG